jgi:hypothetical protein
MSKIFDVVPYQRVGRLSFGMPRKKAQEVCGQRVSSCMYGYPVQNRYLDSYGFIHTLCSSQQLLEGVELFPDVSPEPLILKYDQVEILLTQNPIALVKQFSKITDDLYEDEDAEGYASVKLGLKIYCPNDIVENVILHDQHCYDEEDEYMRNQSLHDAIQKEKV